MKPRIGITASPARRNGSRFSSVNENYTRAVKMAGGIPVILPFDLSADDATVCIHLLDGILFSGGADPCPSLFDEEPIRGVNSISQAHDEAEFSLFHAAAERKLPVFGICRGCQVINVAMGGSLIQDIPSQKPESLGHYPTGMLIDEAYHGVDITDPKSIMAEVFQQPNIRTNSFHHQAIGRLANGLKITAVTKDGIIEAAESTDPRWYILAVQFHPEGHVLSKPVFLGLFSHFLAAASEFSEKNFED